MYSKFLEYWWKNTISYQKNYVVLNNVYVSYSVISSIDGKSMESISSTKMFQKSEYKENGKIIRWTEVQKLMIVEIKEK